jgi:hypothetical protein
MGKETLTASPASVEACVHWEREDIVLLNKRRIALTELTIKPQVRTSSPWPAPCTSSTRYWRKG